MISRWFDIARLRWRSLFRRTRVENELDRELRSHLAHEVEASSRSGLSQRDSSLYAARTLGNLMQIQEECRDMRRTSYIESFARDLQYAARTLTKAPGFAITIILTLALSIGANSAIFSVVEGVILRPLPYPHADRILRVFVHSRTFPKFALNPLDLRDIRARNRSFEAIAGIAPNDRQLSGSGTPERLTSFGVTAGYFRVLGVKPAMGREFEIADEQPARRRQIILSDRIWRTRFHSDRSIIGREIMIDDEPFSVIGVMPPVAHPGNNYHPVADGDTVDVWTPFTYQPDNTGRGSHYMETYARLKPGTTVEQAQSDMQAQFAQLVREHPGSSGWSVFVTPLYEELVGPSRRLLLLLLGAVGLVLLIACANAANLLLARATSRQREIAVRAALGAGRARLVRQMLAESLLISLLGGLCGAAIAVGGVRALVALLPANFPRASAIHVNAAVFAFTFIIAIAVGLLFGLAPALQAARTDLQHAMREGGRSSSSGSRQLRLRNGLVVVEVALACVLLIGAGLMLRSFINLRRSDPGFQPERVLTASISLPNIKYKTRQDSRAFYVRLLSDLSAIPGVRFAGVGSDLPWTGYDENVGGLNLEGLQAAKGQDFHARYHIASENYFQALGVPLVRGRFFTPHDQPKSSPVVIINRVMARSYWGTDDVVGRRLSFSDNPKPEDWFAIVGVVGDVKDRPNSPAAQPAMWWPVLQSPIGYGEMSVAVRAQSESLQLAGQVRAVVRSLDPDLALADLKQMQDVASKSFSTARFALFLAALFAILAAALSAIGIYGVISYSVNQRTHEFGLRMALGANHWSLVRQVMGQGIRLAAIGIVLGLAGALALGRLLLTLLFEVKSADPLTFASVALAAISIAAFACYLPARRATATDPMVALRAD